MQLLKKVVVFLFVGIFITSLVSCKKDQITSKSDNTDLQTDGNLDEPVKDLRDEIYPAFDMGGRTIRIGTEYPGYYDSTHSSIKDCPYHFHWPEAQTVFDNLKRVENKYNVRIEFVKMDKKQLQQSMETSLTTNEPEVDIYSVYLPEAIKVLTSGLALPLSDYVSEYCDIRNENRFMNAINIFDEDYLFVEKDGGFDQSFIFYNVNLVQSLGLEDPWLLYERGEWTWEKFAEFAKLATKDIDGDGTNDQFGYYSLLNFSFLYANNGRLASGEKEELTSPNVIETLEFINRLYNVDKSAVQIDSSKKITEEDFTRWTKGNILLWEDTLSSIKIAKKNTKLDFDVSMVPFPLGPHSEGVMLEPNFSYSYFIPKGVDNPKQVYQIFEEYINWYNFDVSQKHSDENLDYLVEEEIKKLQLIKKKQCIDYGSFSSVIWELLGSVSTGNLSVEESIETYRYKLQEELDQLFERNKSSFGDLIFEDN